MSHKAGFVNIIGRPNVGKSTLMNAWVGERLSIITSKAQTTRHRIFGIVNGEDFQMVISDSPGFIRDPKYKLQETMNRYVNTAFADADVVVFMSEVGEKILDDDELVQKARSVKVPLLVLANKCDLHEPEKVLEHLKLLSTLFPDSETFPVSALANDNIEEVFRKILELLPKHPPFYPKDALTDKPERFFVTEKIREKILQNYRQEIPYSVEVVVDSFKEDEDIIRMRAEIYVSRQSQKFIIIGKGGAAIKKVGMAARKDLEVFFDKKIYLELFVKVRENWRDRESDLRRFGYE